MYASSADNLLAVKKLVGELEKKGEVFGDKDVLLVGVEGKTANPTRKNPYALESLMGMLRTSLYSLGQKEGLFPPFQRLSHSSQPLDFLWVEHFPLFEYDGNGEVKPTHHPFTSPMGITTCEEMRSCKNVMSLLSNSCDLVLNGCEVGGG